MNKLRSNKAAVWRRLRCLVLLVCLTSCTTPERKEPRFNEGDIVRVVLTGERLSIVGRVNRVGVYDERYQVRNHEGYIREMMPEELEHD